LALYDFSEEAGAPRMLFPVAAAGVVATFASY